jgi:hypothetical protein
VNGDLDDTDSRTKLCEKKKKNIYIYVTNREVKLARKFLERKQEKGIK